MEWAPGRTSVLPFGLVWSERLVRFWSKRKEGPEIPNVEMVMSIWRYPNGQRVQEETAYTYRVYNVS